MVARNPDVQAVSEALYRQRLADTNVPEHLRDGLVRYLVDHIRPGSFLCAVLSDDRPLSWERADPESRKGLPSLLKFLQSSAPSQSWGSATAVEDWLKR